MQMYIIKLLEAGGGDEGAAVPPASAAYCGMIPNFENNAKSFSYLRSLTSVGVIIRKILKNFHLDTKKQRQKY